MTTIICEHLGGDSEHLQQNTDENTYPDQLLAEKLRELYAMHDLKAMTATDAANSSKASGKYKTPHRRYPTRLECGLRLFGKVPVTKVVDFFIALLGHALKVKDGSAPEVYYSNSGGIFKDGNQLVPNELSKTQLEHVLIQSFFIWLENAEQKWQRQRNSNRAADFRPSQRTPTPPRRNHQHLKQQTAVYGTTPATPATTPLINGGNTGGSNGETLEELSSKLWNILQPTGQQSQPVIASEQPTHEDGKADTRGVLEEKNNVKLNDEPQHSQHQQPPLEEGKIVISDITVYLGSNNKPQPQQQQRVVVLGTHRKQLVELLAPIEFPHKKKSNVWSLVVSVLELKQYQKMFMLIVHQMATSGRISFALLDLQHPSISSKLAFPYQVVHALLLGPLKAETVEQFVANRTDEFRTDTRHLLLKAETWRSSESEWRKAAEEFAKRSVDQLPPFEQFCINVAALLSDLRNEMLDKNNIISETWAYHLVQTATRKFYTEKTWTQEQLNDLLHTLLVQRPAMKSFVLAQLREKNGDLKAFDRWRNFMSADRVNMSKNFEKVSLCSKDERPEFLSLPRRCDAFTIGNANQFRVFQQQFDEYVRKKTSRVVVGVDAEWNSYVGKSRASLLQLALVHSVYLLDLDALHMNKSLLEFIDQFFLNRDIIKLGYQFGDDLVQLRLRLPGCFGLYRPQSVVCIGQLVEELHRRSRLVPNFALDEFLIPITEEQQEAMKEHTRRVKPIRSRGAVARVAAKKPAQANVQPQKAPEEELEDPYEIDMSLYGGFDKRGRTRRVKKPQGSTTERLADQGLAYLCRRVLGKPLDKQEQCSVWDRRPLRPSQIRYAALDAHCLMQMLHRCAKWSEQLGLGDDPLALMSTLCTKMHSPLPLFWDKPIPNDLMTSPQDNNNWAESKDDGWTEDPNNN